MEQGTGDFWTLRLESVSKELEANNFEAFVTKTADEARALVMDTIIPATGARSVAWGGSMTIQGIGLYEPLKEERFGLEVYDTFNRSLPREEALEMRRRALLADLFITGANAVTEDGMLVNLDMIGNRTGAITFGPPAVIIVAGRNKIVADLADAMVRVRNLAAPANAIRLGMKTPCAVTSFCEDCSSPSRICNSWTITEKSFPKGRIKVVLVNQDLGI